MNRKKTLIVVPMKIEYDPLVNFLRVKGYKGVIIDGKTSALFFEDLSLIIAVAGHGKVKFAITTQYLIEKHGGFELIIIAGSSGALDSRLTQGDIVVSTETIEHDYKMRFEGYTPPPRFRSSKQTRTEIKKMFENDSSINIFYGAIASGDEDVVDTNRAQDIYNETKALCVAWEGAGGARTAIFNKTPFLEIRAISDTADKDAPDSFETHLTGAMENIGKILISLYGIKS